ncbi:Neogenin-like 1 [Homarus americanus]|uniref:Neogenin-like 1 n=1 Tax=Homarus americanus TaxID=6706 RepID=A0A8J5JQK3_HOMAM|nr:Neogenin-like 1 [Homarus americanus]
MLPGPPQGVVVGVTTDSTIELKWNDPAINPLCVQDYSITYGEVVSDSRQVLASILNINIEGDEHFDRHANIGPLLACTNYTIEIKSINKAGTESTPVLKNAATNETDPLPPPFIVVDPSSPDTIDVRWGKNEGDRCVGHYVICWNDGIHPADQCEDAFGGNITITDLLACTHYDVTIEVVTPGGIHSKDVTNSTYTFDIAPGAVSDLQVTDVHKNELTISFDPPTVNGQCVKEYDIHVIDLDSQVTMTRLGGPETIENFITGLHSCTNYEIKVRSVSSTEKASEWLTVQNRTQDDIPSKPQQLGMYDSTSSSISLEWYKPSLNPNCASKYTLTWQDSQGHSAHVTVNDQGTFKQRYTVNGLKTCETYTFNLLAESSAGKSNPARYKQSTLC